MQNQSNKDIHLLNDECRVAPSSISNTSSSFSSLSHLRDCSDSFSLKLCSTESQALAWRCSSAPGALLLMICLRTGDILAEETAVLVDRGRNILAAVPGLASSCPGLGCCCCRISALLVAKACTCTVLYYTMYYTV